MKYCSLIFFLLIFQMGTSLGQVIVIDPGHGGEDKGTKAKVDQKLIEEKDLGLIYAKALQDELKKDFTVYLTRSIDRKLGLIERTEIAQKMNADLFISIHLNSSLVKGARGMEVYYLDNHNDLAIKKVEDEENRSFLDEDPVIDKILLDIIIEKTVIKSKELAFSIHKELKLNTLKKYKVKDRGVKPGLFYVLAKAQRPSILIEIGFMSDASEAKRLMKKEFQKDVALALKKGIISYLQKKTKRPEIPLL